MSTIGAGAELLNGRGPFATKTSIANHGRSQDRSQSPMNRRTTGGIELFELFDSGNNGKLLGIEGGTKVSYHFQSPL
jgi:hypothetical protein